MKRILIAILFVFVSASHCYAQNTTVTATVKDPNLQPYVFSTGYAALVCPGNQAPTYNGYSVPRTFAITGLDGTGTFTQVVYNVAVLDQLGCGYQWHITYKDGVTTFITGTITTVTGSAVNESAAISAYAVLLPIAPAGPPGGSSGQSLANVAAAVVGANTLTWNRLGTVIGTPFQGGGTISEQEPSAFVQTSPQVLSSAYPQVVGMIYTCNAFNICYAEAPHPEGPFTPYSGNPVIANAGCASNILTISGQLVMFACVNSRTNIHRYHSTTHGLSWVDDGLVLAHGGAAWTSYSVDNSSILIVGGVCYLWFDGGANANSFGQGLMTGNSTCAQSSFIENPGDPAIPSTELNGGAPFVYYDGTNFWQWELGGATTANAYPSYVYFTELNTNGFGTPAPHTHTQILLPRFDDEGGGQTGVEVQDADPFVFEWPYAQGDSRNTSYLYYSSCAENCNAPLLQQFTLKVASIPMPMSEIVKIPQADQAVESDHVGWQFVNGISSVNPLPVPTMFDNANRPNSVNMGNDWIALSNNLQAAIVNNQFEQSASTPFTARPLYARVQPNADQFSSVQLIAAASTSNIGAIVRGSPTVVSFYECVTQNALGTSQTIIIRKYVNGSGFTTVATQTGTPQVNDWMMLKAVGSTLTCTIYDPAGNITLSGTDTSIAKGLPGFEIADSAAQGNAILDNWSGGSVYGDGSAATQQTQYWSQPQTFASVIASGIAVQGSLVALVICSGQISLTTGAINSGARATNTLSCTGLSTSTDSISCTFSGDTNAVTGYAPSASGGITLKTWVSTDTVNVDQVNNTASPITPGAATVNCKGLR